MGASSHVAGRLAPGVVGPARVIAFGTSLVAPAASVPTLLVILASYAGFASPLVVVVTFVASLCCAISIGELARRVPTAGWAYTYNSRGLGPTAGFLTGWMMIFGYALFVPAGIALTSVYASRLADDTLHVTRGLTFSPQRVARAAEIPGFAAVDGPPQRLVIHMSDHQQFAGRRIGGDAGQKS